MGQHIKNRLCKHFFGSTLWLLTKCTCSFRLSSAQFIYCLLEISHRTSSLGNKNSKDKPTVPQNHKFPQLNKQQYIFGSGTSIETYYKSLNQILEYSSTRMVLHWHHTILTLGELVQVVYHEVLIFLFLKELSLYTLWFTWNVFFDSVISLARKHLVSQGCWQHFTLYMPFWYLMVSINPYHFWNWLFICLQCQ